MKLSSISKRIIIGILLLSIVCAVIGLFLVSQPIYFVLGVLFGAAASVLKILLLEKAVSKAVDLEPKNADASMKLSYVGRYFLTGVVLIVSALINVEMLYGAAAGVIVMPIAAYLANFFEKDKKEV